MSVRIAWTDDLRRDLTPRDAAALKPFDAAKSWTRVRDACNDATARDAFTNGLAQAGAATSAMEAALALLGRAALPADARAPALGATIAFANHLGLADPLVMSIATICGAEHAAAAVVEAHALRFTSKFPTTCLVVADADAPFAWRGLRSAALRNGEAAISAVARDVWPRAGLALKIVLAHALFSSPDLAADVAREASAMAAGKRILLAPILASLRDATHLEGALLHRMGAHPLVDAVENLGEAALDPIVALWRAPIHDRVHLARVTTCFGDPRAAAPLAKELDKVSTRQIARDYFLRFPDLGELALGDVSRARSKVAVAASEVLSGAKRQKETHDEAPLADCPPILGKPPWLFPKPKRKLVVVAAPPSTRAETLTLAPAVRDAIRAQTKFAQFVPMEGAKLAAHVDALKSGRVLTWWSDRARVPDETLDELIATMGYGSTSPHFVFQSVAVLGEKTIPPLVAWVERDPRRALSYFDSSTRRVFDAIDSHRLAAALAFGAFEPKFSVIVWDYFARHRDAALTGVIPLAVGARSTKRTIAERIVRKIAAGDESRVREIASSFGDAVRASVDEVLAFDERFDCPKAAPKMPSTWRAETFTRVRLRDGRALSVEAIDRIGHMLAFSTLDAPYAGIADVKAACDARSLAELAWDAARVWELAGGRKADVWMLEAIAHLGDDEVVRRTTPAIAHPHIVSVLGHAGTDAAAMELCTLRRRIALREGKWTYGTQADVDAAFAVLARRRGVTVDEVEDALSPTIDLEVPRVVLDYGSRTIDVGFDERLDPFVESARGKLRELPKAGKKDDPSKVARAQEIWRELQEDVAALADVRLASLERAMVAGRSWPLDAFRRAWTDHPLMRHLARGVVWRALGDGVDGVAFRIAEDGTFADIDDSTLPVEPRAIGVAHPAAMKIDERERWRRVFFDYRIAQPIEQLARHTIARTNGATLVLVPNAPIALGELHQKMRAAHFEIGWHNREQVATRTCTRGPMILRLTPRAVDRNVVDVSLVAEMDGAPLDLSHVDAADLSEVAHDLGLDVRAPSAIA